MSAAVPAPDADRLRRLNALLETGLALPESDRAAWLAGLPNDQKAFAPRLGEMLARAVVETDTFMRESPGVALGEVETLEPPLDRAGDRVGPYRLLRELGAGGMATVWLADRADGLLQRRVALKLPRARLGAGRCRSAWRASATSWPRSSIRTSRACTTPASPPPAGPTWRWSTSTACRSMSAGEAQALSVEDAAASVAAGGRCGGVRALPARHPPRPEAVQHPRQRRGRGAPARLRRRRRCWTDGDRTAPLTQLIGRAFTPDYAAPEQIRGEPMTMASDVYSLGVVLYELLTGQRPYRPRRGTAAALEEAITDADVPLASTRVGANRRLERALRGDIDTMLAKALKKNPCDRYANVEAFAADLSRHLAGEPVLARPDALGYRLTKYVRRNRGALVTGALLTASLATGLVGTWTQARRAEGLAHQAEVQRDAALKDLAFAEAAESFMRFMLSEGSDKPLTSNQLLTRADQSVDAQYGSDPALRARMQMVVSDLMGDQRNYKGSLAVLDRAQLSAASTGDPVLLARLECRRASGLAASGRPELAEPLFASAMRRLSAPSANDVDAQVGCFTERGSFFARQARPQESIADAEQALRLIDTARTAHAGEAIALRMMVADGYDALGQTARAVDIYEQQLDAAERIGESGTMLTTMANNLGVLLGRAGQLQRAAQAYERGLAAAAASGGPRDHALAISYARLLIDLGRASEALPLLQRATAASDRDGDPLFAALGVFGTAAAQCQLRRWSLCDRLLLEARARLQPIVPRERALWGSVEVVAARASLARGDARLAERQLREAVARYEAAEDRSVGRVRALALLARIEAERGDPVAAQIDVARALQLARSETAGFARNEWVGSALLAQGVVAKARGDGAAARAALVDAVEQLRPSAGDRAPATQEAVALLAALT